MSIPTSPTSNAPIKVLFLCTGNACRSQMAEAWTREMHSDCIAVWSAGTDPHGLDPKAAAVMQEVGIEMSGHHSKSIDDVDAVVFDWIITVCDRAAQSCPTPRPNTKVLAAPFDDPPALAAQCLASDDAQAPYRRVRDEIRAFVEQLPERLGLCDDHDSPGRSPNTDSK